MLVILTTYNLYDVVTQVNKNKNLTPTNKFIGL